MRRFLLLASLISLLMYTGFVTARADPGRDLAGLATALEATGADLRGVMISGTVAASGSGAQERMARSLGWADSPRAEGEVREMRRYQRGGVDYIGFRWVLPRPEGWQDRQQAVRRAVEALSPQYTITVQLEGVTAEKDLNALTAGAMKAVAATELQPWSGTNASSTAGRSPRLPSSPFGANVQVAARRDQTAQQTRVWVAWPALDLDY